MANMRHLPGRDDFSQLVPKPARTVVWKALRKLRDDDPGLLMWFASPSAPPVPALPPPFSMRAWQAGDDEAWIGLLNASAAFGEWDAARLATETRGLVPETQVFIVEGDSLVAGTGAFERQVQGMAGLELGWVVRHPGVRGAALGEIAFIAALRKARAIADGRPIFLYTDDHRLTAIEIYLRMGFVPDLQADGAFPKRWERVFRALARRRANTPPPANPARDERENAPP